MGLYKQNHIKYALIMCGLIALCLAYMHFSGQYNDFSSKSPVEAVIMMFAPLVVWFFGIKAKKAQLGGKLSFKQGVTEGFKISLAYGIISPFVFLAYYTLFNPGIVEWMAKEYGLSGSSRETVIAFDMLVQFLGATVIGTLYGAIVSFILKTK